VTYPVPVPEQHEPSTGETNGVGWVTCSCGHWEAWVTGARSAGWARREFDEHLTNADAARADVLPPG
jgi:hypothetical protein